MMDAKPHYFSYLLRLWLVGEGSQAAWRASLDDPRTDERLGFPSLEALFDFLKEQVNRESGAKEGSPPK
jgi:hypothetical protein